MRVTSNRRGSRLAVSLAAAASLAALTAAGAARAADDKPERSFEVYGFAQADYVQDFKRVNPAWDDTLRPSRIPTIDGQFGDDGQAIIGVRQSRLGVRGWTPIEGQDLNFRFEIDMFGVGVDEGQTTLRLRHAYGEWGRLLAGQTHSLFMDIDLFPNVIDYWGPAGMVFLRTPQLRWTFLKDSDLTGAVAIEKPGNDIDAGQIREIDPALGANIQGDEELPDLTGMIRWDQPWGHLQGSAILRRIGFETLGTPGNEPNGHETGWGVMLGGNYKTTDKDKLIVGLVYGEGIASYMNDGGVDLAPEGVPGNLEAKAVPLFGVDLYYDHYWNDEWSSSIGWSRTQVDNTSFQSADAFHSGDYASVNLLYTPDPNILMGAEFLYGRREDNDGATGEDYRLQISVKYSFSSGNVLSRWT